MDNNNSGENIIPTPGEVVKKAKFNKSFILVGGLVILTAVLLIISITSRNSSSLPSISRESQTNTAYTNLSISEELRASTILGKYETDVNIDSGKNQITGVQLEISYDPKVLTNVDIVPGSFFPTAVIIGKEIDPVKGTILYTLGTAQGTDAVSSKGSLAVISFNKIGDTETSIEFLPETLVTDHRYDQSVLNETESGNIGILPTSNSKPLPTTQ